MTRILSGLHVGPDGVAEGFAFDPRDPAARLVVELLADGLPVALLRAQDFCDDARLAGRGDGCHGFAVALPAALVARTRRLEVLLANTGLLLGAVENPGRIRAARAAPAGACSWAGGLRITGWTGDAAPERDITVKALVDGVEVARAAARDWVHRSLPGGHRLVRSFDLHLPLDFADGRVRVVTLLTAEGEELDGSPLALVAFSDGLAEALDAPATVDSERVRVRFAEGLLPQSMPFAALAEWLRRYPLRPAPSATVPRVAVVLVGEAGADKTLASLDGADWTAAVLAGSRAPVGFDPRHLRAFLAEGDAPDLVVATVAGTRFAPGALALLHAAARLHPDADTFYGDVIAARAGEPSPLGFPAYDDEFFLERGYCGLCFAMRPAAVGDALAAGADSLFRLFGGRPDAALAGASAPVHLPKLLATLPDLAGGDGLASALLAATEARLAARGEVARVTLSDSAPDDPAPAVRVRRPPSATVVSVLIPLLDDAAALRTTLDALAATTGGLRLDVVIAEAGCGDPATRGALDRAARLGHRVVSAPGPFCVPRLLGAASAAARGEHLLMLRAGIAAEAPGWLEEMLGRCAAPRVGVVGALVAWGSGVIRHAGVALGPRLSAVPRFRDHRLGEAGPAGLLRAAHRCAAVSADALLTPRPLFAALGGFDAARFSTGSFDVDYCLRVGAGGGRVILTPHARLRLDAPDPSRDGTEWEALAAREAIGFRTRWGVVPGCDPFYSPWMAMDGTPYSGLGWPPVEMPPRQPEIRAMRPIPRAFGGREIP